MKNLTHQLEVQTHKLTNPYPIKPEIPLTRQQRRKLERQNKKKR